MKTKLIEGLPAIIDKGEVLIFSPYQKKVIKCPERSLNNIEALKKFLKDNSFSGFPSKCMGDSREEYQLTLVLTSDCNLRCKYCFVQGGKLAKKMSEELACAAIDRSLDIMLKKHKKSLIINFFGGEPTLEINMIKKLVSYANSKAKDLNCSVSYGITTNGVFSESTLEYLVDNDFSIAISADGIPEIQNIQRPFPDGSPSSAYVEKTIKRLVEKNANFRVRMTVTKESTELLEEIVKYYANLGLSNIHIEVVNIAGRAVEMKGSVSRPDAKRFIEILFKILNLAEELKISIVNSSYMNIMDPVIHYCDGIGGNKLVVSYDGFLSSCVEVQNKEHPMANVFQIDDSHNGYSSIYDKPIIEYSKECNECFAKYLCAGGCPSRNYHMEGNVYKVDRFRCEVVKAILPYLIQKMYISNISPNK